MATVFTRIIEGDLPGRFVWRDDQCVAFLSINPLRDGHLLVVPRTEIDHWTDAPPEVLAHLTEVARVLGEALRDTYQATRVGMLIAGIEVPHLHIHVVPIDGMGDLDFANADPAPDPGRLDGVADAVRTTLRSMGRTEVSD